MELTGNASRVVAVADSSVVAATALAKRRGAALSTVPSWDLLLSDIRGRGANIIYVVATSISAARLMDVAAWCAREHLAGRPVSLGVIMRQTSEKLETAVERITAKPTVSKALEQPILSPTAPTMGSKLRWSPRRDDNVRVLKEPHEVIFLRGHCFGPHLRLGSTTLASCPDLPGIEPVPLDTLPCFQGAPCPMEGAFVHAEAVAARRIIALTCYGG